ncbi:MAG: hypothetical protein IJS20_06560, partial [Bacteroidales bacterium]|nr:hypothetical protein [Bacteroidales bacterium]
VEHCWRILPPILGFLCDIYLIAGVALRLPPACILASPSGLLFYHFNRTVRKVILVTERTQYFLRTRQSSPHPLIILLPFR